MDDRQAQFLIAVGDLCTAAGLAGLDVELRTENRGETTEVRGVPHPRLADEHRTEVDHSGYAAMLTVGGHIVNLEDVIACTVHAPGPGR